jgi:hypothetical protein
MEVATTKEPGKAYFIGLTAFSTLLLFIPRLLLLHSSAEKSCALGAHTTGGAPLWHNSLLLAAVAVACTLACDALLNTIYCSKLSSFTIFHRWLNLLVLGIPNGVIYICSVFGDVSSGE